MFAYVFKTRADQFAGRINLFRVYQGVVDHDTHVLNTRTHAKERIGQLLSFLGKETPHADEYGPGDIGAVAKLKDTRAGDWLAARDEPISMPSIKLPAPVMAFAMEAKGDEDKVYTALRRLQEEDPTIDLHRDPQTGEQIVAGLSQIHVEVIVDRLKSRFGAEVDAQAAARARTWRPSASRPGRTAATRSSPAGAASSATATSRSSRWTAGTTIFEFVNRIKGGVIPVGLHPRGREGRHGRDGATARSPATRSRACASRLVDGSYHTVDSSEQAFRTAGSIAMKEALANAGAVLLEPIMLVTLSMPEESVGDVIGDLNSRRGRPQGMEPSAAR